MSLTGYWRKINRQFATMRWSIFWVARKMMRKSEKRTRRFRDRAGPKIFWSCKNQEDNGKLTNPQVRRRRMISGGQRILSDGCVFSFGTGMSQPLGELSS